VRLIGLQLVTRERSQPGLGAGTTVPSLQAAGTELSVHILFTRTLETLFLWWECERAFGYGYRRGQGTCCSSVIMLREVQPC
jgi:hypothetical protein